MEIRDSQAINRNSARYEQFKMMTLDLYILYGNASACYEFFRRATSRDGDYRSSKSNAAAFFRQEDNVEYMENRKKELYKDGFEKYSILNSIDISDFKKKEDKYHDLENITADELRSKNMTELEEIKEATSDANLKVQILKQQTDLMDAKRKERETLNSDTYMHYYLPYPDCTCYKKKGKKL